MWFFSRASCYNKLHLLPIFYPSVSSRFQRLLCRNINVKDIEWYWRKKNVSLTSLWLLLIRSRNNCNFWVSNNLRILFYHIYVIDGKIQEREENFSRIRNMSRLETQMSNELDILRIASGRSRIPISEHFLLRYVCAWVFNYRLP